MNSDGIAAVREPIEPSVVVDGWGGFATLLGAGFGVAIARRSPKALGRLDLGFLSSLAAGPSAFPRFSAQGPPQMGAHHWAAQSSMPFISSYGSYQPFQGTKSVAVPHENGRGDVGNLCFGPSN
jgi:hypothetical protein